MVPRLFALASPSHKGLLLLTLEQSIQSNNIQVIACRPDFKIVKLGVGVVFCNLAVNCSCVYLSQEVKLLSSMLNRVTAG